MPSANNRLRAALFILGAMVLLALAKPAVHLFLAPEEGSFRLDWDYGVPTRWYGTETGGRPSGVKLPENSIGLDFLSFDTYIRCKGLGPDIYGSYCAGDPFSRPFAYPPLLTAAFFWIPLVSTPTAVAMWSLAVLALVFANGALWAFFPAGRPGFRLEPTAWCAVFLLTISYPAVFAFERGNTEVLILSLLGLTAWAVSRQRWFAAGFLAAVAALAKMYPLLTWAGCAALGVALILTPGKKKQGVLLMAGSVFGFFLPFAMLARQHVKYFDSILPSFSSLRLVDSNCSFCHSWPASFGGWGYGLAFLLGGLAVFHFVFFGRRFALEGEPSDRNRFLISFAYALAVSVYVPHLSYDYSLVMLLPLFMMCLLWDAPRLLNWRGVGCLILLVGTTAPRWLEGLAWREESFSVFLILQTAGLMLIGFSLVRDLTSKTR